MRDTVPTSPLAIDLDAPDSEPGNPAIAFKVTLALGALEFVAGVMFGARPVLFFDAASFVSFLIVAFAWRAAGS